MDVIDRQSRLASMDRNVSITRYGRYRQTMLSFFGGLQCKKRILRNQPLDVVSSLRKVILMTLETLLTYFQESSQAITFSLWFATKLLALR